jgi:hypothetical protein
MLSVIILNVIMLGVIVFSVITLKVVMPSVFMLSVIKRVSLYNECYSFERQYAKWHNFKCHYVESCYAGVIKLNVITSP